MVPGNDAAYLEDVVEAGWWPDPWDPSVRRYHDGRQWGKETKTLEQVEEIEKVQRAAARRKAGGWSAKAGVPKASGGWGPRKDGEGSKVSGPKIEKVEPASKPAAPSWGPKKSAPAAKAEPAKPAGWGPKKSGTEATKKSPPVTKKAPPAPQQESAPAEVAAKAEPILDRPAPRGPSGEEPLFKEQPKKVPAAPSFEEESVEEAAPKRPSFDESPAKSEEKEAGPEADVVAAAFADFQQEPSRKKSKVAAPVSNSGPVGRVRRYFSDNTVGLSLPARIIAVLVLIAILAGPFFASNTETVGQAEERAGGPAATAPAAPDVEVIAEDPDKVIIGNANCEPIREAIREYIANGRQEAITPSMRNYLAGAMSAKKIKSKPLQSAITRAGKANNFKIVASRCNLS